MSICSEKNFCKFSPKLCLGGGVLKCVYTLSKKGPEVRSRKKIFLSTLNVHCLMRAQQCSDEKRREPLLILLISPFCRPDRKNLTSDPHSLGTSFQHRRMLRVVLLASSRNSKQHRHKSFCDFPKWNTVEAAFCRFVTLRSYNFFLRRFLWWHAMRKVFVSSRSIKMEIFKSIRAPTPPPRLRKFWETCFDKVPQYHHVLPWKVCSTVIGWLVLIALLRLAERETKTLLAI